MVTLFLKWFSFAMMQQCEVVLTFFIKWLRAGLIILQLVPYESLNEKFYNIKSENFFFRYGNQRINMSFLLSNFVIELY